MARSKTSTFRLFEVTFLLEKWKLVCLISTFRLPRRSKSGWRKQDSVLFSISFCCSSLNCIKTSNSDKNFRTIFLDQKRLYEVVLTDAEPFKLFKSSWLIQESNFRAQPFNRSRNSFFLPRFKNFIYQIGFLFVHFSQLFLINRSTYDFSGVVLQPILRYAFRHKTFFNHE